jgi:hypothetical protein
MRFTVAAHIITLFAAPLHAQLVCDPPRHNLGEVRGGQPASCEFRLRNGGDAPIEIVDLERSCGCLVPEWQAKRLAPGESGQLKMRFRTLGQPEGERSWIATIVYRVDGETRRQSLTVTAIIRNDIVIDPPQLALFVQDKLTQEIVLVDRREKPLQVIDATTSASGVRIVTDTTKRGRTTVRLTADAAGLTPGRHDDFVRIATDDPVYGVLEVPLTLMRVEKRRVTWSPETPEVILAPGQKKGSVLVRLRSEKPFAIERAEGSEPGITSTWAVGDDGTVTMRISVDRESYRRQALQAAVRLHGAGEVVAVPLLIRVEP